MIEHEQSITYHRGTVGFPTREGDKVGEISGVDGEGIEQTQVIRLPAGLPGERVTIAIEAARQRRPGKHRRRWRPGPPRAWITEIHEASPLRRQAPCPVFGTCGGCQFQHMEYKEQLGWKRAVVDQLLHEVGGFEHPPLLETVACDDPWHYRNHMRFSVTRDGEAALTPRAPHRVFHLPSCP